MQGFAIWKMFYNNGEEQEKEMKECLEMLETFEEYGLGEKKYFHGEKIGMVDLAFGSIIYWLDAIEEVIGVKVFEPKKFPRLHTWTENFEKVPILKENLPNREEMVVYLKLYRERVVASA